MTNQEEKQIVSLFLNGDKESLMYLYKNLYPRLKKFIKTKISTKEDIEELSQDTFLNFIDALPLFSHKSSLWTFLVSIAKHEVSDYYRKQYAKKTIKSLPLFGNLYERQLDNADQTALQLHQTIELVYSHLKPTHALILRLKYQEQKSIKQIAQILNLSHKATESLLYRARSAFQLIYVELYGKPSFSI